MDIQTVFEAEKIFRECHPDHEFVLASGRKVKSVSELSECFLTLSHEEYTVHANFIKNDFANWIEHVFHLKKEADELRGKTSLEESSKFLGELVAKAKEISQKEKEYHEKIERLKASVPKPPVPKVLQEQKKEEPKEEPAAIPQEPKMIENPVPAPIASEAAPPEKPAEIKPEPKAEAPKEPEKSNSQVRKEEIEKALKELTKDIKNTEMAVKDEIIRPQAPDKEGHKKGFSLGFAFSNPILWVGLLTGLVLGVILTALGYSLLG